MIGFTLGLLTVTGAFVWIAGIIALLYYRPTIRPQSTLREAITGIRWSYAIAFFVLPPTLAGFQEGIPELGFAVGVLFIGFVVTLQWWWPI